MSSKLTMRNYKLNQILCLFLALTLYDLCNGESTPCLGLGTSCYMTPESCCHGLTCDQNRYVCSHSYTTTFAPYPKCQGLNQQCHHKSCCTDLFCNKAKLPWKCEKIALPTTTARATTTTSDTTPSCRIKHKECGFSEECCPGLTCSGGYCEIITSTTTESPKHCLGKNANCKGRENSCCRGFQCVEDALSNLVCKGCNEDNVKCEKDEECCKGLSCQEGYCTSKPTPQPGYCLEQGANCRGKEYSCCNGLKCDKDLFNNYLCNYDDEWLSLIH